MEISAFGYPRREKSACGVGFVASRKVLYLHDTLQRALDALACVEHRGACAADQLTGDGAGIMADIPFDILGYEKGKVAVATLFVNPQPELQRHLLKVFEETFGFWGLKVLEYREVPVDTQVLGTFAKRSLPTILQAIIARPAHCNTDSSFDKLLYTARQMTWTRQREALGQEQIPFFFASLSANTIVYKALTRSQDLAAFYPDLRDPRFKTRFAIFHRRFSTNTVSSWDKAQPFRFIGHNGEINTIEGNRSWGYSREKSMGLPKNELLTHEGISDSGSLNEMAEALMYRSSLPHIEDALALMMPPAEHANDFYRFWGRAMEPWDGPALIVFSDGQTIGARLDRNGFRPCRWAITENFFYLSSEAGSFQIPEDLILRKGALSAGQGVTMHLDTGHLDLQDPSQKPDNYDTVFDARLRPLDYRSPESEPQQVEEKNFLFGLTEEDLNKILEPMVAEGKEPIGSMGDTARPAILSEEYRSFFDYFYQNFAQVTNPPLDYLREKMVTDLRVALGKSPNIFAKKELIPPPLAYECASPILSLGQMEYLSQRSGQQEPGAVRTQVFSITFKRAYGAVDLKAQLERLVQNAVDAVHQGVSVLILSDRSASWDKLPIPALLALRAVLNGLDQAGLTLKASIVVDSGQVRSTHHVAALVAFGASAVCPWQVLSLARTQGDWAPNLSAEAREKNLLKALEGGLLKVMSKMGISVVSSYRGSKLFTIVGLDKAFCRTWFPGVPSLIGGLGLEQIAEEILAQAQTLEAKQAEGGKLLHNYLYKEHPRGASGEQHSMTASRSKLIHQLVRSTGLGLDQPELYKEYLSLSHQADPVNIRHLFTVKSVAESIPVDEVQPLASILRTFGSGAMSFGAISAESQRDIILAMQAIGGRSNSGEGGENPYYYSEGLTSTVKQIASGRFGVTATYIITGEEIQIKIAQGAKPGEGGQLMAPKVGEDIARARHSLTHVDLISPPPMHDIYSIEDLKQLIYEVKQIKPEAKVNVKLVSGANIGTIAVGVAKAGADIIHISGGDGGTGAASLSSMKHAGLPWEFGVVEAHRALVENNLRSQVILRTDGGLQTGQDVLLAALLGADQFDFGKLLLVAQGCIMARVCEKNTCPTGIATHDPRFKAKYKGTAEHIVKLLSYIGEDLRQRMASLGIRYLADVVGRTDLLAAHPAHKALIERRNLDLSFALHEPAQSQEVFSFSYSEGINRLNQAIVEETHGAIEANQSLELAYPITTSDRAIGATLAGALAKRRHWSFLHSLGKHPEALSDYSATLSLSFTGSAGQGFGVFTVEGMKLKLYGEANDSVGKTMSGGEIVITPHPDSLFTPSENVIIGNCALYGATGGRLFVQGLAGDRFAVRNSGATAVVEGAGLHACEYMTQGKVVILGPVSHNVGSGMTGGEVILFGDEASARINREYIAEVPFGEIDAEALRHLLIDYLAETGSPRAQHLLDNWSESRHQFRRFWPINLIMRLSEAKALEIPVESETLGG